MKKVWAFVITTLAVLATYIGVNQLTNRGGYSDPIQETEQYGLGLPKSAGTGAGTRNTEK